jgi:hypothetical protein
MKVLDLQCARQHVFEGWFASEHDFSDQQQRGLVACPLCGDTAIAKKLSAPRLNLGHSKEPVESKQDVVTDATDKALQAAWLVAARRILAQTEDVGERFAEEARKIHYGEVEERGIRGKASRAETESLMEEGIVVMPLPMPDALNESLQ